MNTYKEIKEIAKLRAKTKRLINTIAEKCGDRCEGVDWDSAEFVSLDKEDIQDFITHNGEDEDYFVEQSRGYCEDDYYGHLYFKTDVPGQYVKVYFEC